MLWVFVPIYCMKQVCNQIKEALDRKRVKKIATEDLVKIAEFVLKNNYFKFDRSVYQ